MLARPSLAIVVSMALLAPRAIEASPITYDFAGTFNQPVNGSNQFSGSFTIDSNPTVPIALPSWDSGGVGENGSDVSLTVNMGGQTVNFVNTSQNPENATFQAAVIGSGMTGASAPPVSVDFTLQGYLGTNNPIGLSLNFSHPGTDLQLADIGNLNSPSFTASVVATNPPGAPSQSVNGSLTSIEQVPAPEPSTLAVFAVMAIAAMAHRRFRRS